MSDARLSRQIRVSALLFLATTLFAALIAILLPFTIHVDRRFEAVNAGLTLARTGTLGDPFQAGPTGSTAHMGLVFPAIVALLTFSPAALEKSLATLAIVLCGLTAAILPVLSRAVFGVSRPGLVAGLLGIISVGFFPQSDVGLSSFLCSAACGALILGARPAWVLSGLAALSNPACILPILVCSWNLSRKRLMAALAGIALFCLPWMVRNWIVLGYPAPVRDNFGLELSIANNDCAGVTIIDNGRRGCFQNAHPNFSPAENARVRELGELRYNRMKMAQAISWIRRNPVRFGSLTLQRAFNFLFPSWLDGPYSPGIWMVTAIAIPTVFMRWIPQVRMLHAAALAGWAPYLFVQSDVRYRALTLWIWLLLAGFAVCNLRAMIRLKLKTKSASAPDARRQYGWLPIR